MKGILPSKQTARLFQGGVRSELSAFRLLAILVAFNLVGMVPLYPEGSVDPFFLRLGLAGLLVLAVAGTFLSGHLRSSTGVMRNAYAPILAFWSFWLMWVNAWHPAYVLTACISGLLAAIVTRGKVPSLLFGMGMILACLGMAWYAPSGSGTDPVLPMACLGISIFFITAAKGFFHLSNAGIRSRTQFLKEILDETPDALLVVDPSTQEAVEGNLKARRLLGLTQDSLKGEFKAKLAPLLPMERIMALKESQQEFQREIRLDMRDGPETWLSVLVRAISIDDKPLWLIRLIDITREVVMRQDLIRSHTILNNLDHLIIVCDAEARFTYISPSVKQILGFEPEELLGDGWWKQEFGRKGDVEKMKSYARECASGRREVNREPYEQEYRDRKGQSQWILWKDVAPGDGTIIGVGYLYTQLRRTEQMRRIILNIAEAAVNVQSLTELYAIIHREITSLIKARNFYIGLETGTEIISPYFIDQERPGSILPESGGVIPRNSLSGYTMRLGKDTRLSQPEIEVLQRSGDLENYGPMPKMWMGAPLFDGGTVIGLIALVDYEDTAAFSPQDQELLGFVASQIGSVVSRFNQQEKLKLSEERYRLISEASFEGFAMHENQRIIEANQAYASTFGYTREELIGMDVSRLADDSSMAVVLDQVRENREALYRFTARRKDGSTFQAEALGRRLKLDGREVRLVAIRDITEKLRAEELAQAAKFDARFQAFVQHSNEVTGILTPAGEIQYMSPSVKAILGFEPEELTGSRFQDLVLAEDRDKAAQAIAMVMASPGSNATAQYSLRHKGGFVRIVESFFTNLTHDPLISGVLVSSRDVTERIAFEQSLRESEERFRALFEHSPDAIYVEDEQGFILDVNEAACQLQGRPREELVGMNVMDLVPEELRSKIDIDMGKWFRREITQIEAFSYRRDGTAIPVEIRAVIMNYGGINAVVFQVRDTTEMKQVENALRASERQSKALLDAIPDAMYRIRKDGVLLDYKPVAGTDRRSGQAFVAGKRLEDLLPHDIAAEMLEKVMHAIQTGDLVETEYMLPLPTGQVDYDVRIVRSGNEEALVMERDVTRRKETERELIRRNFELDSFVYRSSHDLKAPLNSIMGLISILRTETEDDVVLRYLSMMNKSVEKLDSFIRDLTDFSRNERQDLVREEVSLSSLVEECIENLRYMENADRVRIIREIHESVPFHSDGMRLGIILNNLISNAVKYQNHQHPDPWVRITVHVSHTHAVITVADNGIGIKQEYLARMFQLFFRASLQSYGSGLGLYIVKNTVEKLGGEISLETQFGKGSSFTVTIPNVAENS